MSQNKLKIAKIKAKRQKVKQDASETILRRLEEAVEGLKSHKVEVDTTKLETIVGELELSPTFKSGDVIVDTEIFSKQIAEVKGLLTQKKVRQPSEIKQPLEDLVAALKLKPSQSPEEFVPYRRVVKVGNRLQFDDYIPSSSSHGGGSTSEGGGSSASQEPFRQTDRYGIQAISDDGTYKYFFFEADDASYYILRKTSATSVFKYTKGTGGYAAVYVDSTHGPSGTPTWADRGATF